MTDQDALVYLHLALLEMQAQQTKSEVQRLRLRLARWRRLWAQA